MKFKMEALLFDLLSIRPHQSVALSVFSYDVNASRLVFTFQYSWNAEWNNAGLPYNICVATDQERSQIVLPENAPSYLT